MSLNTEQEGSLCAQHCLNALLQGPYFTAVDLAEIARQLDESERRHMAVAGEDSEDYRRFLEQGSTNMDDSGFFSIQVINKALEVWALDMIPYNSPDPVAVGARENPVEQQAFICNFKEHWLSIRKLGHQWFNLNSLLTEPELVSDTFLAMFLMQLQQEGYSIFVITGHLPDCEADQLLQLTPAVQPIKPKLITESQDAQAGSSAEQDDSARYQFRQSDLEKALAESAKTLEGTEEDDLQKALKLSVEGILPGSSEDTVDGGAVESDVHSVTDGADKNCDTSSGNNIVTAEEIRLRRLAYLDKPEHGTDTPEKTEEEDLQQAIKMSMEST
ncbi:ataxin-3 isoform X2 [Lingula anatina]|uniref:ubiquitinyl hydrolase 1 n=1 Tax=Lingula anatina TaxID=7574 RepID=A0A1S3ISC4_LINAN|nr:ataxin-3 isoform X2 [Lingula anatina]|eukprot:XP_013400841.1 ataxin-3 isoform X2 [Lingula anatina]